MFAGLFCLCFFFTHLNRLGETGEHAGVSWFDGMHVHIAHHHVVGLEEQGLVDLALLIAVEDSLLNDGIGVAMELVKGALRDVLANARPNDGACVANEVRDREDLLHTLFIIFVHNELVVVRDAEVKHSMIASLHFDLVGDEVRAEHQHQRSQCVGLLGLSSWKEVNLVFGRLVGKEAKKEVAYR